VLIRIVNLGGWGILEPWITPSIFEQVDQSLGIIDEYTLCQNLETGKATDILYSHWATFYTFGLDWRKLI
jgi:glucan 1,3-beta-glucosidase